MPIIPELIQPNEWKHLYARRMEAMRSSAVRDLFEAASRPGIISLSGGMPDIAGLPLEEISASVARAILEEGVAALQYGNTVGRLQTREVVCDLMKDFNIEITPDDLIITSGAQQALELLGKTMLDRGDIVITEGPSYLGALQAFSAYEPDVHTIASDKNGMNTDLLAEELALLGPRGAKFIYTIPNFNNPSGVTMSLERRKRLLELAREYNILVIEDDAYGRLRFEGEHLPALRSLDPGVLYLGTVSKVFAPGLRTGWVIGPQSILDKIKLVKQGDDLCGSTLNQVIVERYFTEIDWRSTLDATIGRYRIRRDALLTALEEFFPAEAQWTCPQGGLFVWITLPETISTKQLLPFALEKGVTFVPGDGCYPAGRSEGNSTLRVCFSYETPERLREAIRRLAEVIKEHL